MKTASTRHSVAEVMASTKYGSTLPARSSNAVTGVAIIASIVPRSHSRATTREVSVVPISVITIAIDPGTRKLRLASAALNHTRC